MNHCSELIPSRIQLAQLLGVDPEHPHCQLIAHHLFEPLQEFLGFHGKKIRAQLLELAFCAAGGTLTESTQKQLELCSQLIEGLHLGSLIIDDIQDQSEIRRGTLPLHRKYGIALALNAGNWLYFQSLDRIRALALAPHEETALYQLCHRVLIHGHLGQAIDVGVQMGSLPQTQVEATCTLAMELKTGVLMSLAFDLGSFIATRQSAAAPLAAFAKKLGVALQVFNDIRNFLEPPPKGKEDLRKGRPSYLWIMAARTSSPADYQRFVYATQMLPEESFIRSWVGLHDFIPRCQKSASDALWELYASIDSDSNKSHTEPSFFQNLHVKHQLRHLFEKLETSYA